MNFRKILILSSVLMLFSIIFYKNTKVGLRHESFYKKNYSEQSTLVELDKVEEYNFIKENLNGYSKLFENNAFRNNYFSKNDFLIYSPWRGDQYVLLSWSGCINLFKKEGADIIIIGASDSAYNLPLDLINKKIKELKYNILKVLLCSRVQMSPSMIYKTLQALEKTKQKAQLIIWGYGAPSAFNKQFDLYSHFNSMQNQILNENLKELSWGLKNIFSPITWKDHENINEDKRMPFFLPEHINIKNELNDYLVGYTQTVPFITDEIDESGCEDFSHARIDLNRNLNLMKKLSKSVYLYLTPSTELEYLESANCYLPIVRALLRSYEDHKVIVNTADLTWYDLEYKDFLFNFNIRGKSRYYLNPNHNNYEGAKKIVSKLVDDIFNKGLIVGN